MARRFLSLADAKSVPSMVLPQHSADKLIFLGANAWAHMLLNACMHACIGLPVSNRECEALYCRRIQIEPSRPLHST